MTLKLIKPDAQRVTRRPKLSKTSQMRQLVAHYAAEEKRKVKANHFELFKPFPGVLPTGATLAMDFDDTLAGILDFGYQNGLGEGLGFLGYSVLSELMQRPEYRRFAEIFAEEMTRKFIRVISASDEDQGMRIKLINDAFDKFKLKDVFYRLAFIDCAYGRAQLYVDMGPLDNSEKRSPLIISKETVPLRSLVGFKAIEPMWTYPVGFNSMDPTSDDFYKPRAWYSMGVEYHATRMIPFVGREVPDMLKPVYQFGGLSLTQMVKPYVDNWIRTRQNVGDAIEQFAQNVLKTNLESVLEGGGGEDLDARVALYNAVRSARGTMVIDKDTEDFMIASMPLGNLDKLQAQAQEQMCCLVRDTLVETDRGQVAIQHVRVTDKVMTRDGWAPLSWSGRTGFTSDLIEIKTDRSVLIATGYHPIWLPEIGEFVTAENVKVGQSLLEAPTWSISSHLPSFIEAVGIRSIQVDIAAILKAVVSCIVGFGKTTKGLFRKALSFTTSMKTPQIISSIISDFLPELNTTSFISSTDVLGLPGSSPFLKSNASFAEPSINQLIQNARFTVVLNAKAMPINGESGKIASVRKITNGLSEPVYNLEVAEGYLPEFYANGVLVHNSVAATPLIKYLGITPSGLNASTDNEVRTFFDTVAGKQTMLYGPHMKFILDLIMQSELGEVNPDISYTFEALWQMSETERATMRSSNAMTAGTLIDKGVISPEEERKRLAGEEDGMYPGLDPDDLPEPPQQPGADPFGGVGGPDDPEEGPDGSSDEPGGQPKPPIPPKAPVVAEDETWDDIAAQIAADAEWEEHKHPRAKDGKFGKGDGSAKAEAEPEEDKKGGKKESITSKITKLLYDGHSHEDIVKKLDLPANKTYYPGWVKADLAKKGLKSYQAKIEAGHEHEEALAHLHDHDKATVLAKLAKLGGATLKPKAEKVKAEKEAKVEEDEVSESDIADLEAYAKKVDPEEYAAAAKKAPAEDPVLSAAKFYTSTKDEGYTHAETLSFMPKKYVEALKGMSAKEIEAWGNTAAKAEEAPKTEHPLLGEAASHYKALKDEGYSHGEALTGLSQNHKDALKGMGSQEIEDKADAEALSEFANQEDDAEFEAATADNPDPDSDAVMADYNGMIEGGSSHEEAISEFQPASQKIINEQLAGKTPEAPTALVTPSTLDGLTKVGSQLGSNPGGTYTDTKGNKFYVKHSKSDDHAKNEVLAGKLYQLAGAPVLAPSLIDIGGGKLGTITPWATHEAKYAPDNSDHGSEVEKHFATHAWTGNWDALGLTNDNQVKVNGKFHTVDVGGALKYRAQGQAKKSEDFSDEVKDVNSLLDPSKNANAAHAFKALTTKAKKESAQAVVSIPNEKIAEAIISVYGANVESATLLQKLIKRKESVAMQLGADTSKAKAPATKTSETAQKMAKDILANLSNVTEKNKPIVTGKLEEIDNALKSESPETALKNVQPIGGSSSVSKGKVNEYLHQLKTDHGALPPKPTPPAPSPPGGAPIPTSGKSAEIYKAVSEAPPKKLNDTFEVRHPDGKKIKAKLALDTAAIPANWHAAVTAALEGDHDHKGKVESYEVHNIMDKYYDQVTQKIASEPQKASLKSYKGSGYTEINKGLLNPPPSSSAKTKINHLKALIDKSSIPADIPVWRGMRCDLKGLVGHDVSDPNELVGKGFVHKNFASVSRKESTSTSFAGADWGDDPHVMMKFTLPAGAKGALTSGQAGEAEIVMNANSIFRIDKVESGHGNKGKGHLLHVTYLGQQE